MSVQVELDLFFATLTRQDTLCRRAELKGDQRRQGELALPGESGGRPGMGGEVVKGLGVRIVGKGGE